MDRNLYELLANQPVDVASREGGVDRNIEAEVVAGNSSGRLPRGGRGSQPLDELGHGGAVGVASREGGVDRNRLLQRVSAYEHVSPPARGAWIAT